MPQKYNILRNLNWLKSAKINFQDFAEISKFYIYIWHQSSIVQDNEICMNFYHRAEKINLNILSGGVISEAYKNVPQHLLSSAKLCNQAEWKLDLADRIRLVIFENYIFFNRFNQIKTEQIFFRNEKYKKRSFYY